MPPAQPPAINQMHSWQVKLATPEGRRYEVIAAEIERWKQVAKASDIKVD